jgi:hypothetical protein
MRFAYLILAHSSFKLLRELIVALDSPDNDIYVHVDLKAGDMDPIPFIKAAKYSNVCFLSKRINVYWGHISIVEATLNLMSEAAKGDYDYVHLLSGVDFPVKSQSYIQSFFKEHDGKEFVGFSKVLNRRTLERRTVWRQLVKGRYEQTPKFILRLNSLFVTIQRKLHLHCTSPDSLKLGSQWFSITKSLALKLVNQKEQILKRYKHVLVPDEMFLQTYLYENNYMDRVYNPDDEFVSCCRYIDWSRGEPYVWQDEDYDELVNSQYLWARKFSESNMNLIHKIKEYIKE